MGCSHGRPANAMCTTTCFFLLKVWLNTSAGIRVRPASRVETRAITRPGSASCVTGAPGKGLPSFADERPTGTPCTLHLRSAASVARFAQTERLHQRTPTPAGETELFLIVKIVAFPVQPRQVPKVPSGSRRRSSAGPGLVHWPFSGPLRPPGLPVGRSAGRRVCAGRTPGCPARAGGAFNALRRGFLCRR